jgi:hypothetical protein
VVGRGLMIILPARSNPHRQGVNSAGGSPRSRTAQVPGPDLAPCLVLPPSLFEHPAAELSVDDSAQLGEDRR